MQHPRPVGPTGVNAQAAFGQEMVAGSRPPERSRFYTPVHRQGLSLSQTTHVPAPFTPDMAAGSQPSRQRYAATIHQGITWWAPEVNAFSVEMAIGSHPDRSRVLLGARIGLPLSQTTHVAAAFGVEMVVGSRPDRNRAFVPPKLGLTLSQPTHTAAAFSIEMTQGVAPAARVRVPVANRVGWLIGSLDAVVTTTAFPWLYYRQMRAR